MKKLLLIIGKIVVIGSLFTMVTIFHVETGQLDHYDIKGSESVVLLPGR